MNKQTKTLTDNEVVALYVLGYVPKGYVLVSQDCSAYMPRPSHGYPSRNQDVYGILVNGKEVACTGYKTVRRAMIEAGRWKK